MGCAFPWQERAALVAAEPEKFLCRFHPSCVTSGSRWYLTAIDAAEMRELVTDGSRMVVPKKVRERDKPGG